MTGRGRGRGGFSEIGNILFFLSGCWLQGRVLLEYSSSCTLVICVLLGVHVLFYFFKLFF